MKKIPKITRVKQALLAGRTLTGKDLNDEFYLRSYRDTIYHLRQAGMDIKGVPEAHSDGKHNRWYMTSDAIDKYKGEQVA